MSAILVIIIVTPTLVNSPSGTQPLGPIVHNGIAMLLVAGCQFTTLLGFDFDILVLVAACHTIYHPYEGDTSFQC